MMFACVQVSAVERRFYYEYNIGFFLKIKHSPRCSFLRGRKKKKLRARRTLSMVYEA